MRIITGSAKGTKLITLEGEETRPTTEKVKEAVFSAIQFELAERSVLDLFGGCGQLALEALSRGAKNAVIVDSNRSAVEVIKANAAKTKLREKCRIITADWRDYLKGAKGKESFGLVFLDPPYQSGILDEVLQTIYESDILAPDAILVCESDENGVPEPRDNIEQRLYKHGRTYVSIIRYKKAD